MRIAITLNIVVVTCFIGLSLPDVCSQISMSLPFASHFQMIPKTHGQNTALIIKLKVRILRSCYFKIITSS